MAWGVLEDKHLKDVPGTTLLSNSNVLEVGEVASDANLKKEGNTVLVPQPSNSVNDPLNWSAVRKNVVLYVLAVTSGATVALGPMVTSGFGEVIATYHVSVDQVSTFLVGTLVLATGAGTFFTSAAAAVWGKRPVFMISTVFLLVTCVWGFYATSFESLAVMRIVQGVAAAPVETLVTSTVSDLFFVHQRGQKLAVWGLAILTGVLMGQVIAGALITSLGFASTFGVTAMVYLVVIPLMYFFVPETNFDRTPSERTYIGEKEEMKEMDLQELEPKKAFVETLEIYNGRISDVSFWATAIKPIPLVVYPAVIFSTIVYGSFQTWLISFSLVSVSIFSAPPYNLTAAQIGLTNLPQFFTGLVATGVSGWFADWVVGYMARKNKGVYEPEYRLTMMVPALILSTVGMMGFGISVGMGLPVAIPVAFQTINSLAVPFATSASFTYVIDCHPKDANQAFVTINFLKAIMIFTASLFINSWFAAVGPTNMFITIGSINAVICCLTIPIYMFGKRFRSMVARSSLSKL